MINREAIFRAWAPADGIWSPWVKPVLFAHVQAGETSADSLAFASTGFADDSWAPQCDGACAIVLDLPGAAGVGLGLSLARKGYRPVPLYNALPMPGATFSSVGPTVVCNVQPIIAALSAATQDLVNLHIAAEAPPVFLLDSARRVGSGVRPMPGTFDNRSVSLPTDFPSASRLHSTGVKRVIVVQERVGAPQEDLAHTLLRWQAAGIRIEMMALNQTMPVFIRVTKPPFYKLLWQRALAVAGLRRNPLGGFGGTLPMPSAG
jgi:hypothetical protein